MIPFPKVNMKYFLRQAATDIITMLTDPPSTTTPSLQAGDPIKNTLLQLATLLQRVENITDPKFIKPNKGPTPAPMFTKPNQDPAPAPMFAKPSKVPTPAPMFIQQEMQQFTNDTPIPPQRVQQSIPPQRMEHYIAKRKCFIKIKLYTTYNI